MTDLVLDGCRTMPLGGYLSGLGVLRAVTRLRDHEATGRWEQQRFVLGSRLASIDELVEQVYERFEPEALVSPWNAGSGFAANGKNPTAERALQSVRDSEDPRLARLREAVLAADAVVAEGRRRGWGGKGGELWDPARKPDIVALCRSRLPDTALPWIDAAVVLGQEADPAYSRLLGTGANFGAQDLQTTYLARLQSVLADRRSRGWLRSVLTGDESVTYLRGSVGQFDPGRSGGIQSSPLEKADAEGFVNPWSFLLVLEGALLFATALVRRHGAAYRGVALPFQVRGSTAGFASAAADERASAELWAPEWNQPASLAAVSHLLGEGRAEWRHGPARSGLDFVRAVATLGVDRGITAFERHVFVDRLGKSPLAVPAGRIEVTRRGGVQLLADLDGWLDALRRASLPSTVATRLRGLEQAIFEHARTGGAAPLADVFAALGRCHEAVSRSGAVRASVPPLVIGHGKDLLTLLRPALEGDRDLRLALALATARDGPRRDAPRTLTLDGLRRYVSPVQAPQRGRRPSWTETPSPGSLAVDLPAALAEAVRRRSFPGATDEVVPEPNPAVGGVRIAFEHGLRLHRGDHLHWLHGDVDEQRVADLLAGLLTVDWSDTMDSTLPGDDGGPDPALDVLLPFTGTRPLDVPLEDGGRRPLLFRPASWWPVRLAAERADEVLADAAHRLRIGGVRHVVTPVAPRYEHVRLAAVLLSPVPERSAALRCIAALPDRRPAPTEEIPA